MSTQRVLHDAQSQSGGIAAKDTMDVSSAAGICALHKASVTHFPGLNTLTALMRALAEQSGEAHSEPLAQARDDPLPDIQRPYAASYKRPSVHLARTTGLGVRVDAPGPGIVLVSSPATSRCHSQGGLLAICVYR